MDRPLRRQSIRKMRWRLVSIASIGVGVIALQAGIGGVFDKPLSGAAALAQAAAASNNSTVTEGTCVECHLSKDTLESLAVDEPMIEETGGCGAPPPNIPKSEKLLVGEDFLDDIHGKLTCVSCHQGSSPGNMQSSHEGMVRDPSIDEKACGGCHPDIVSNYSTALHNTLQGQITAVEARSHPGIMDQELAEVNEVDLPVTPPAGSVTSAVLM